MEGSKIHDAVQIIERAWLSSRDRQIFKMLKHTICAAETSVANIFLQTISPLEAELLQDPAMSACVRLRFGGSSFPPLIYFKIFLHHSGPVIKYLSGKTMIHAAATEANEDCLRIKGPRIFYEHLLQDNLQHHCKKTTDFVDVVTLKDYMQYLAFLDETPAKYGGKSNYWRLLSLNDVPRHTIFYDIVEFLYSGKVSGNIREHLSDLLVKPVTSKIQLLHLNIISALKSPISSPLQPSVKCSSSKSDKTKRRSKQAVRKVSKMKELYERERSRLGLDSNRTSQDPSLHRLQVPKSSPSFKSSSGEDIIVINELNNETNDDLSDLDTEARQLYEWTQHLSIENIMPTPQLTI